MVTGGSKLPPVPLPPSLLSHLWLPACLLHCIRGREKYLCNLISQNCEFVGMNSRFIPTPHLACPAPLAAAFSLATRLMRIMIMMILWRIVVVAVASCCWCVVFALFAGLLAALAAIIVEILCSRPSHDHNGNSNGGGGSNRKT